MRRLRALEAPAGLIRVEARVENGRCVAVSFDNLPAFAAYLDATVEMPELGEVTVDVAWGGMWYVIADARAAGHDAACDGLPDDATVQVLPLGSARRHGLAPPACRERAHANGIAALVINNAYHIAALWPEVERTKMAASKK